FPRAGLDRAAVPAGDAVCGAHLHDLRAVRLSGRSNDRRAGVRIPLLYPAGRFDVRGILVPLFRAPPAGPQARLDAAGLPGLHVPPPLLERDRDTQRAARQIASRVVDGTVLGAPAHQVLTTMITAACILRTLIPALLLGPAVALALPPLEQLETRVELSPAAKL